MKQPEPMSPQQQALYDNIDRVLAPLLSGRRWVLISPPDERADGLGMMVCSDCEIPTKIDALVLAIQLLGPVALTLILALVTSNRKPIDVKFGTGERFKN